MILHQPRTNFWISSFISYLFQWEKSLYFLKPKKARVQGHSSNTALETFLKQLHEKMLSRSRILIERDPAFIASLKRCSDIDRKIPAAVIQPRRCSCNGPLGLLLPKLLVLMLLMRVLIDFCRWGEALR